MANWEDAFTAPNREEEETPIFTALYLEYREAAFRRISEKVQARVTPEEAPGKDARREEALNRAREEDRKD